MMTTQGFPRRQRSIFALRLIVLVIVYLASARGGLALAVGVKQVTAVWPPTGLALAAVVLWGQEMWPAILVGAFLANVTTHEPALVALAIAAGNTLEAIAGGWLLAQLPGFSPALRTRRDMLALVLLAGGLSTALSATVGVLSLQIGGVTAHISWSTWRTWWLGNLGGDVLVAPVLLILATARSRGSLASLRPARVAETVVELGLLGGAAAFVFLGGGGLPYVLFPVILIVASRARIPGAIVTNLVVSGLAIGCTAAHLGPFAHAADGVLRAQIFSGVVALTSLLVAASVSERRHAVAELASSELLSAQLKEAEQRQRLLLDSLPDTLVALYDRDLRCLLLHGPMLNHTGVDPDAFVGRPIAETLPPEQYRQLIPLIQGALEGESGSVEYRSPLSGLTHDIDVAPYRLADGSIAGAFAVAREITQRLERESVQRRLAAIVEHSADAITSKSADGMLTAWNSAAERLYGYAAEEALGRHVSMLVPAHRAGEDEVLLRRALGGETVRQFETERLHQDGTLIDVAITVSPILDADRRPAGASVITRDITARKRTERELSVQARMLEESQILANVGCWEWELDSPEVLYSGELCRILGRPVGWVSDPQAYVDHIHPDDRLSLAEYNADLMSGEHAMVDRPYRIVRCDGEVRHVNSRSYARRDVAGAVTHLYGTVQDVTGLHTAELALRSSEQQFRSLFEHAAVGMVQLSRDGAILKVNQAFCAMVGYSEVELAGRAFTDITHPEDVEDADARLATLLSGEVSHLRTEKRYLHKAGIVVWAQLSVSLVRDSAGQPSHFVSQIQDITVERSVREAMIESERRYQSIAANVPGMVFRFARTPDGEHSLRFASDAARDLYEVSPQELMKDHSIASAGLLQADRDAMLSALETSARTLVHWQWRGEYTARSGEVKYLQCTARPFCEPDGTMVWDGVTLDRTAAELASRERAELRQRLELVLENLAGSAVVLYDRDLVLRFYEGPLFSHIDTDALIGQPLADTVGERTLSILQPGAEAALSGETSATVLDADEDGRTLRIQFAPYRLADDSIDGVLVHWHDISAVRDAERDRDAAREHFQVAFEQAPIGMVMVGLDGRFLQVNAALSELTGYGQDDLLAMAPFATLLPDDLPDVQAEFAQFHTGVTSIAMEHRMVHSSGHHVWVHVRANLISDENGAPVHVLAQVQDISERRRYEDRLKHMADHDPLTGLLNRRGLEAALEGQLARCRRYGPSGALLMLDLDGFKMVNDTLGHAVGDQLIVTCAHAISARVRDSDTIARLGGDEFAVILPAETRAEAEVVAQALVTTIREHASALAHTHPGQVTASVGLAMFDDSGITADEMLVRADLAMYEAKDQGKDCYALYSHDGQTVPRVKAQMTWLQRIEEALDEDRMALYAQPIIDLRTGRIDSHEILVRMIDEHGDLIPPNTFLYIAERFGLMPRLDRWIVTRAIRAMADQAELGRRLPLAVNISGTTAGDLGIIEAIEIEMRRGHLDPRDLTIEITETAAVADIPRARHFAQSLKDIGCRFALDDFGAGFGSFYYLKHLPFDIVKLDGEFVENATQNPADRMIIKAVTELTHGLGKQVTAEFVPDDETVRLLLAHGVDLAQGFYLGRPVPLATVLDDEMTDFGLSLQR